MEVHCVNQVQPEILSWEWRKGEGPRPPGPLPCPMGGPKSPLSPPSLAAHGHLSQHEPCTSPAHHPGWLNSHRSHPGNPGHGEVAGCQCTKARLGICEPHSHQGPAPQHPQPFQKVSAPDRDLTRTRKWWVWDGTGRDFISVGGWAGSQAGGEWVTAVNRATFDSRGQCPPSVPVTLPAPQQVRSTLSSLKIIMERDSRGLLPWRCAVRKSLPCSLARCSGGLHHTLKHLGSLIFVAA